MTEPSDALDAAPQCPRCGDSPLEAEPLEAGALARVCGRCEGRLLDAAGRAAFGPALEPDLDALPDPFAGALRAACPCCGGRFERAALRTTAGETYACGGCGAVFLGEAAFVAARRFAPPDASPVIHTHGLELELDAVRPAARAAVARGDAEALRRSVPPVPIERRPAVAVPDTQRAAIAESAARTASLDAGLAHARLPVDEPVTATYGPLVAWSVALLSTLTHFGDLLVLPVQIQFHELGHALAAWAAGRVAVPLPCGITFVPEQPSSLFTALTWALLGAGLYVGVRARRTPLVVLMGGALVAAMGVRLFASTSAQARFVLVGGFYGELLLPTLLALLYHHDPIPRMRWDFVRLLALPVAATSMLRSLGTFVAAERDPSRLMGGTFLGGDPHGSDLERIMRDHGADPRAVMRRLVAVAVIALVAIAAQHVGQAVIARRNARAR